MEQLLTTLHALIMAVLDVDPRRALLATLIIVIVGLATALHLKGRQLEKVIADKDKALAEKDRLMSEADQRNDARYADLIEKHNARVDGIIERLHSGFITMAQAVDALRIHFAGQGPRQ